MDRNATDTERWGDTYPYQGCEKCRHGMHRHSPGECPNCACPLGTARETNTDAMTTDYDYWYRVGWNDGAWSSYRPPVRGNTDEAALIGYNDGHSMGADYRMERVRGH